MGRDPFSKKLGLKTPKALSPVQLFIILTAGGGGNHRILDGYLFLVLFFPVSTVKNANVSKADAGTFSSADPKHNSDFG